MNSYDVMTSSNKVFLNPQKKEPKSWLRETFFSLWQLIALDFQEYECCHCKRVNSISSHKEVTTWIH